MTSSVRLKTVTDESHAIGWGRFALVGLITIVVAALANVLVYVFGGGIVAYDPRFLPLAVISGVLVLTALPALVAVLLYAALLRFTRRPERIFGTIAGIMLVISFIPDLTYATGGQVAILMLMHLVAAAVIVGLLTTLAGS